MSEEKFDTLPTEINASKSLIVEYLARGKVHPDENQIRKEFPDEHIASLRNSIKEQGILDPIKVILIDNPDDENDGEYLIVDGECRYRATKEVDGYDTLPCVIMTKDEAAKWAITSAFLRRDLNPIEKSEAIIRYLKTYRGVPTDKDGRIETKDLKLDELTAHLGLQKSSLSEIISLQWLSEDMRNEQRKKSTIPLRKLKKLTTKKIRKDATIQQKEYDKLKKAAEKTPTTSTPRAKGEPNKINLKKFEGVKKRVADTTEYYSDIDVSKYKKDELAILKKSLEQALADIDTLLAKIDEQVKAVDEAIKKPTQEQSVESETSTQNTSEPTN